MYFDVSYNFDLNNKVCVSWLCRLNYLHSQKIVHRDVKTENMLLDKAHTVKIADFGVARVEASNPNDMTGETGTLGYMAPEVFFPCSFVSKFEETWEREVGFSLSTELRLN